MKILLNFIFYDNVLRCFMKQNRLEIISMIFSEEEFLKKNLFIFIKLH